MTTRQLILEPSETDLLPYRLWRQGVTGKVLWRDDQGHSVAGLLNLEPGASIDPHVHHYSVHHLFVTHGSCEAGGRTLSKGTYAFIPAETLHGIEAAGPTGCTLLYLYLQADLN